MKIRSRILKGAERSATDDRHGSRAGKKRKKSDGNDLNDADII